MIGYILALLLLDARPREPTLAPPLLLSEVPATPKTMHSILERDLVMIDIRKALREAVDSCDCSQKEKRRLKFAIFFPGFMKQVEPQIEQMLEEEYRATGVGAVDWATIIKFFIENILPLILKLLEK